MRRIFLILGALLGAVAILALGAVAFVLLRWDHPVDRPAPVMSAPRDSATVAWGGHIFKDTWQCWGCHASVPEDGNAAPSGGQPFDLRAMGPGFGVFYSANLTPDVATGIGGWTDGEVVQAMREGIRKDRGLLFPLMPFHWLKDMSDRDALAIVAYLRSLPPVVNRVPPQERSFMTKALTAFGVFKPLPAVSSPILAPPQGVTPEYGRYIAQNLSGCADCHTPRNLQDGSFFLDSLFAGSDLPFGEAEHSPLIAFARNLRPVKQGGLGSWTEEQFTTALKFGMRPDGTVLAPHMPYSHFKYMTDDECRAVFAYLQSLSPLVHETHPAHYTADVTAVQGADRGKFLFAGRCRTCHGTDGKGARPTNAILADVAPSLGDQDLAEFIAGGQLNVGMPAFGKTLSQEEIADVVRYIRTWEKKGQ